MVLKMPSMSVVAVAIAHARTVDDQAVVEQRAVAIRRRLHLLEQVSQHLHVIGIDAGFLRHQIRVVFLS